MGFLGAYHQQGSFVSICKRIAEGQDSTLDRQVLLRQLQHNVKAAHRACIESLSQTQDRGGRTQ